MTKPLIICLCGSTRFVETFNNLLNKLTLEGKIVLGIELVLPQSEREDPQHSNFKMEQALDELHLRKIDLADEVMILNVDGYIGESTRKELDYARNQGKVIKFLEPLEHKQWDCIEVDRVPRVNVCTDDCPACALEEKDKPLSHKRRLPEDWRSRNLKEAGID